jgi:hypothetical protein
MDANKRQAIEQGLTDLLTENREFESALLAQREDHEASIEALTIENTALRRELTAFHADRNIELEISFEPDETLTESLNAESH